jgi:hypothetical protein
MATKNFTKGMVVPTLLLLLVLSACSATKHAPVRVGFPPYVIDTITIFPVVDLRVDKNYSGMEMPNNRIISVVKKDLIKKGYNVDILTDRASVSELTEDDLSSEDASWIKQIGPPNSKWILLMGLLDHSTKLTFGTTSNAEVTGYLFSKDDGKILWHQKGIGKSGQGGIAGMLMGPMVNVESIGYAATNLISNFPYNSQ